ncbi:MAG: hypothetical protein OXJ37_02640 [Bryobacterales bacterium]|nr:hypothetical protein [Bryobacterales bacterium]MDE0622561.1 hypothetical protein [Bryobacterales bacterium]
MKRTLTAALLAAGLTLAQAQEGRLENPVVFQRAELSESGDVLKNGKLWVMEADGSGLRQITFGNSYDEHPSLYSDLEHVLYSEFAVGHLDEEQGGKLVKINIRTGKRETVAEEEGCALHHATLSPVRDLLAYHFNCGTRFAQVLGMGSQRRETAMQATNGIRTSRGIIVMHEKNRGVAPREVALAHIMGTGEETRVDFLTDGTSLDRRAAISPDEQWMAWQTNAAGPQDEIFLARIDGSEPRNLTNTPGNDGHPWFSRDGQWLVFESDRTGNWEIWRLDLRTGEQLQLTDGSGKYVSTRARM